jgi:uncharacterized protein (TIGR00645 family)
MPLYVGLVGVLILLAVRFIQEFIMVVSHFGDKSNQEFILEILALLDLTLLANLILIVIFAGYENFVSRIDAAHESVDKPHWMGTIVIELLKDFIELSGDATVGEGTKWRIFIHLTFVVSGVLFAVMDWVADKRETVNISK